MWRAGNTGTSTRIARHSTRRSASSPTTSRIRIRSGSIDASDYGNFDITPEQIRRSRRGYFANISYLDDKVGELLDVLERTRMLDDTIILFCSDHGDMLGERGLWFKMCFFEGSARVPLMIAGRGIVPGLHRDAGLQPRHLPYALRPRRHRHERHRAMDRW